MRKVHVPRWRHGENRLWETIHIDPQDMPQQTCAWMASSIHSKKRPNVALWVVLRLGRMGGTFTSSSWKCHRRIKAPFPSFILSLFLWFWGQMDLFWRRECGSASLEMTLGPEAYPWDRRVSWFGTPCTLLRSLLFCTPLCYCEVWSVDSVFCGLYCVGEDQPLSLGQASLM